MKEVRRSSERRATKRERQERQEHKAHERRAVARQRRRSQRPPRLRFEEGEQNYVLTVPPRPRANIGAIALLSCMALSIVVPAVMQAQLPSLSRGLGPYWLSIAVSALVWLFAEAKGDGLLLPKHVRVTPDGRWSITVLGSRVRVAHGDRGPERLAELHASAESAFLSFTWRDHRFGGLGDADIEILQRACSRMRVPLERRSVPQDLDATVGPWWSSNYATAAMVMLPFAVVFLSLWLIMSRAFPQEAAANIKPYNVSLDGSFRSSNDGLGHWELTPERCLVGRERGFEGMAFLFPAGSPVKEIRLDTAREGDNLVEIHLADQDGTVYRAREDECEVIDGSIILTNLTINGRPMQRAEGSIGYACPKHGIEGHARYDGCLPL